jgi:hypothetical protein
MTTNKIPEKRRASDILYDEISESRNSVRRDNIRRLKMVCDQMEKDKVEITGAEVSRRCGENGPAYSTISNKGSKLGEYLRLRVVEQAATLSPGPGLRRSIADTVSDPVLQAQIRDKESTARWLTKENTGLRTLLKSLRPGVNIDNILLNAPKDQSQSLIEATPPRLSVNEDELRGMLLKLMDHLTGSRQYKELRGRLTINGKVVLDVQELQIFREATGLQIEEWKKRYVDQGVLHG